MRLHNFAAGALLWYLAFVAVTSLSACGGQPGCADNPRNMSCFTADGLEKELAK